MKYKLIIFDFDGTLADTFSWFTSTINKVADKYKFKRIKESEYEIIRNYDIRKVLKYLDVPLSKMAMIENHLRTLMAKDIGQLSLFEGIENLLKYLSNCGFTLALVTSNSRENVHRVLGPESAALINYYECGVSMLGKQDKLEKIVSKSGIPHNESIYIGDEIRDSEAAKKANIAFGGVSWGYNTVELLKAYSPKEVFANINEIIEKIS